MVHCYTRGRDGITNAKLTGQLEHRSKKYLRDCARHSEEGGTNTRVRCCESLVITIIITRVNVVTICNFNYFNFKF